MVHPLDSHYGGTVYCYWGCYVDVISEILYTPQ